MSEYTQQALNDLEKTLAFIKTFDHREFDTIYSEREWRSVSSYNFKLNDVAALILPEQSGYYRKFVTNFQKKLKLPSSIKIHRWEDI